MERLRDSMGPKPAVQSRTILAECLNDRNSKWREVDCGTQYCTFYRPLNYCPKSQIWQQKYVERGDPVASG